MNVRRRNVQARVGEQLQNERNAHTHTQELLATQEETTAAALAELDKTRIERDQALALCHKYLRLTAELGPYFKEGPAALPRDTELFRLMQELAPQHIPPTGKEILQGLLDFTGITIAQVVRAGKAAGWMEGLEPKNTSEAFKANSLAFERMENTSIEDPPMPAIHEAARKTAATLGMGFEEGNVHLSEKFEDSDFPEGSNA